MNWSALALTAARFLPLGGLDAVTGLFEAYTTPPPAPQCRCVYGQPCWPNDTEFASLQSLLSQPLVYPKPTAHGCYGAAGDSEEDCSDILAKYHDGPWRSNFAGSMEAPFWESYTHANGTMETCYANATIAGTCEQGNVPVVAVDARTAEDIQDAVGFAVEHNLRVVVKNTGCVTCYIRLVWWVRI